MTHPGWADDWTVAAPSGEVSASAREKAERARRRRRRRIRRRVVRSVVWTVVGVVAVVVAAGVWVAVDIQRVRGDLESAAGAVTDLQEQVLAGDADAADATARTVQRHARDAASATARPHWSLLSYVPWVGPNVSAVRVVAGVVDDLAQDALPNLAGIADVLDPAVLAPTDGVVNLEAIQESADVVIDSDAAVQDAAARVRDIDSSRLLGPVADAVDQVRSQVDEVAMQTRTASRAVQLLPPMLGADGPRSYLLLVQNNAEPRSTGGIPGAVIELRADAGRVEIVDQETAVSLGAFRDPVLELTEAEVALFGTQLGRYVQDVTFTPHFPRTAELVREMWHQRVGTEIDGVLAVDPVGLQAILAATGPVVVEGEELTSENAADRLLNGIYLDYPDPMVQDEFFAEAASAVFDVLMSGEGDTGVALDALAGQARDGRLLVWSAHGTEQGLLSGTVLAGEVRGQLGTQPVIGLFVNDGSAAKIGYYLDTDVTLTSTTCRPNGSQALTLTATFTSTAPADAATSLPGYITGSGSGFVDPGSMQFNVLIYASQDGVIDEVRATDGDTGVLLQVHEGLPVAARTVLLAPGESLELEVDLLTGPDSGGVSVLRVTPGSGASSAEVGQSACA